MYLVEWNKNALIINNIRNGIPNISAAKTRVPYIKKKVFLLVFASFKFHPHLSPYRETEDLKSCNRVLFPYFK